MEHLLYACIFNQHFTLCSSQLQQLKYSSKLKNPAIKMLHSHRILFACVEGFQLPCLHGPKASASVWTWDVHGMACATWLGRLQGRL